MKALSFKDDSLGSEWDEVDVPEDLAERGPAGARAS